MFAGSLLTEDAFGPGRFQRRQLNSGVLWKRESNRPGIAQRSFSLIPVGRIGAAPRRGDDVPESGPGCEIPFHIHGA